MKRMLTALLALLFIITGAQASRRGQEPRVSLDLERSEAFTGEAYSLSLKARADGFIYLYALDPDGYVNLLYPVLSEDGRGQVRAGDSLFLAPLYAGAVPGAERLVAVHTREFRPIKPSRHRFLAPDPQDLQDIHSRLTRSGKELDNYATLTLSVLSTGVSEEMVEEEVDSDEDGGLVVHQYRYDYWCDYCDCWHPACTHEHCWCGWEVVGHYHSYYHFSHCFLWESCHTWWRPPVIYIYIHGGSPWDYDTRPWRPRRVWSAHREGSGRWRHLERPRLVDPASFVEKPRRAPEDKPQWIPMKQRLEPDTPQRPAKSAPSVLSTDPKRLGTGEEAPAPQGKPSTLSTRPQDAPEAHTPQPEGRKPYLDRLEGPEKSPLKLPKSAKVKPDGKGKGDGKTADQPAKGDKKPDAPPKSEPKTVKKPGKAPAKPAKDEPKPDKKPDKDPDKKPEK